MLEHHRKVSDWNLAKEPGFQPSKAQLMAMNVNQLKELVLSKLLFCNSYNGLERMTFEFKNGIRSPPVGTYNLEPDFEQPVPNASNLKRLVIGLHKPKGAP